MPDSKIITICGSMRFYQQMLEHASKLTAQGVIVLMPFVTSEEGELKTMLEELHKKKIDISDGILVVNCYDYFGSSTRREIAYAESHGKTVEYVYE